MRTIKLGIAFLKTIQDLPLATIEYNKNELFP